MRRYAIRAILRPELFETHPNWSRVYRWRAIGLGWTSDHRQETVMDKRLADVEIAYVLCLERDVTEYVTRVEEL